MPWPLHTAVGFSALRDLVEQIEVTGGTSGSVTNEVTNSRWHKEDTSVTKEFLGSSPSYRYFSSHGPKEHTLGIYPFCKLRYMSFLPH